MTRASIRKMKNTDRSDIVRLCEAEAFNNPEMLPIAGSIISSKCKKNVYVALSDNKLIGFVFGFIVDSTLMPQFLYVVPEFRNKHIGKKLMQKLEDSSKCAVSLVYYNKNLHDYYYAQGYKQGTELEVAIKQLGRA